VLGALRATGTTAVLVTHDQDEALSAADYIAVLHDGVITHEGTPRAVYSAPADPWTASFLGTANLLPGVPVAGPSGSAGVRTALGWHELRDSGQFNGGAAGSGEVTVLIRPEQIALSTPAGSGTDPGAIAGTVTGKVTQTRYHGHDALIAVDVREAGLLQVRALGTPAGEPPAPGDEVILAVSGPVMAWRVPPAERDESGPVEVRRSQGTV